MPEASFKKNFLCHKFEARQRFLTSAENPRLTFPGKPETPPGAEIGN